MPSIDVSVLTILEALTRDRLLDLARVFAVRLRPKQRDVNRVLAEHLVDALGPERLRDVLDELGRDELRRVCSRHGLDSDSRRRADLIDIIVAAAGFDAAGAAPTSRPSTPKATSPLLADPSLPTPGSIVSARGRQWLVDAVASGTADTPRESPLVSLACLDDDDPGRELDILWNIELGARVVTPETDGLGLPARFDPPEHFGAYLHALQWSAVSAADEKLFQAPFRSGIKLMPYQLIPLMKALEMPRANLLIADDVGLGKTIEAGLVIHELVLRRQVDFVLVVCPATITLQWRDEMMRRFGLRFEVMSREFVARRRRERGFGVNPWATHNRFIVSMPLIRRPEYRDPLLAHLGARAEKGLLVVDEAHVAAPAAASRYAVDSETTRTVRELGPRFAGRLFLTATPHNGHSNSFTSLLEIIDPMRFLPGDPQRDVKALEPVMVRRLKRDLREIGHERFPRRVVVRLDVEYDKSESDTTTPAGWRITAHRHDTETDTVAPAEVVAEGLGGEAIELESSEQLARYTELAAPTTKRGRLVFVNLQKRLLSSPEAFARTLEVHARAVERRSDKTKTTHAKRHSTPPTKTASTSFLDPETYGPDEDVEAARDDELVRERSRELPTPPTDAATLLDRLRTLAQKARGRADGKTLALMAWLREHACAAVARPDADRADNAWSDRRVIVFTEYLDTLRYLHDILGHAIEHTDHGDERIMTLHGGLGDETREDVQHAFNTSPDRHPVRILLATDAAREGINLQAHCADLFHFDVPWNPSRLEQRNGRIDRTLQPEPEVRCHYFAYPERREDRVLLTLMEKVTRVQRELGSAGAVVLNEVEKRLEHGIDDTTAETIAAVDADDGTRRAEAEVGAAEARDKRLERLEKDIRRAGRRLSGSRGRLEVRPETLRGVVDVGLSLAGGRGLVPAARQAQADDGHQTWTLPELDSSWDVTLDTLRPPRRRDETFRDWRKHPPRSVTFEPLATLTAEVEQLHLGHPLVRRVLDRFLAQGYGAHDLTRVGAALLPDVSVSFVVAYARLTLFGRGAVRLHDEIIAIPADWAPTDDASLTPCPDAARAAKLRESAERALTTGGRLPPPKILDRIRPRTPLVFAELWPALEGEADARATDAENGLRQRARKESEDLKRLLDRQRDALDRIETMLSQGELFETGDRREKLQLTADLERLRARRHQIPLELEHEPAAIESLYEVRLRRVQPVGLLVAWPEDMT